MSETTFDFGWGQVPVHRHENGNGWVADTAMVEDSCYIGIDALVYGNVRVCGGAKVHCREGKSPDQQLRSPNLCSAVKVVTL